MSEQARNFITLVAAGAAAGLIYDIIRIFRRLFKHGALLLNAEDILFWFLFTLGVMLILLWESNGVIRLFSLAAPIIGLVLYFGTLSRLFLPTASKAAGAVLKAVMVILHIFCIPFTYVADLFLLPIKKVLYKFNKIVKKLLKKILKYEKIAIRSVVDQNIRFGKAGRCNKVEGQTKKEKKAKR